VPLIVRKGDGAYLYATTDLAAVKQRVKDLKKDWIIYVTDNSQREHFRQVFEVLLSITTFISFLGLNAFTSPSQVARRAGWYDPNVTKVEHVTFGLVHGKNILAA